MIEVEAKLEIVPASWPRVQEVLATMYPTGIVNNTDIYYDTREFDLLRQAVFVRIRNQRRLEFKFNEQAAPEHLQSAEHAFPLQLLASQAEEMNTLFARFLPCWRPARMVEEALSENGLVPLAFIENKRAQYVQNNLSISVDQVHGLGYFLEIERQCEEGSDTSQAQAEVLRMAEEFAAQPLRVGYVELWLQKHNVQAYQCGKYHQE